MTNVIQDIANDTVTRIGGYIKSDTTASHRILQTISNMVAIWSDTKPDNPSDYRLVMHPKLHQTILEQNGMEYTFLYSSDLTRVTNKMCPPDTVIIYNEYNMLDDPVLGFVHLRPEHVFVYKLGVILYG